MARHCGAKKHYSISGIDWYLWDVMKALYKHVPASEAERLLDPLVWFIRTGRASTPFLKALVEKPPYMIARRLRQNNKTYDKTVNAIKAYVFAGGSDYENV